MKIITETEQVIEIMMVDDRLKVMVNDKKIDVDEFEKFKWVASVYKNKYVVPKSYLSVLSRSTTRWSV